MIENQEVVHAYDASGNYVGLVVATPAQLADQSLSPGNAPAPDLAVLKSQSSRRVIDEHAEMLESLSGNYTAAERDTWSLQLEWARGYLADQNAAHAALLAGMVPPSQATTEAGDAQMMADKIVAKANQYAQLVRIAQRTKAEAMAAIDAAATVDELDVVLAGLKDIEAAAIAELASA